MGNEKGSIGARGMMSLKPSPINEQVLTLTNALACPGSKHTNRPVGTQLLLQVNQKTRTELKWLAHHSRTLGRKRERSASVRSQCCGMKMKS